MASFSKTYVSNSLKSCDVRPIGMKEQVGELAVGCRRKTPPALCRTRRKACVVGHLERRDERESHVSLETPLSEEIATLEVGGHTEPRVGMMNCLAHGEVRAPL